MKKSAGILMYRNTGALEFFLVHPGGPFWKNKEAGAWSIPKGELDEEEAPLAAAQREFEEETGQKVSGEFIELTPVKQKAGKLILAWAVEGNVDAAAVVSNSFQMEWPYKSGRWQSFPEVDKAGWFTMQAALEKINPAQAAFIQELMQLLEK